MLSFSVWALFSAMLGIAFAVPYEEYILAPASRTLHPVAVYQDKVNGTVTGADTLAGDSLGSAFFQGVSAVTYDFGKNIGGIVSLTVGNVDRGQYIGLTYTESSLWISGIGSDATANYGMDEPLWFQPTGPGVYTVDRSHERGGFRYLSLVHNTTGDIEVTQVTTHFTAMPHWAEDQLKNYTGYFHCDDELLNRIFYAGAYTDQLCTIDPHYGDALVHLDLADAAANQAPLQTWYSNTTITNGSSALVDGAKRDRLVWPGDMSIAVPAIALSTYDLVTIANSLDSLYLLQNKTTGLLPYAGVPFPLSTWSATYHLYSLIGVADYYLYSGNLTYVADKWDQWKFGLNFSLGFIDSSGLMNVTSPNDWLRFGMGGHNIEVSLVPRRAASKH